jgi:hypothetical protein
LFKKNIFVKIKLKVIIFRITNAFEHNLWYAGFERKIKNLFSKKIDIQGVPLKNQINRKRDFGAPL